MRRRQNVSAQEKADLDTQIKGLKEIEQKIKKELDRELNELENLPRSEVASRRAALGKLQKDFERIKVSIKYHMIAYFPAQQVQSTLQLNFCQCQL